MKNFILGLTAFLLLVVTLFGFANGSSDKTIPIITGGIFLFGLVPVLLIIGKDR